MDGTAHRGSCIINKLHGRVRQLGFGACSFLFVSCICILASGCSGPNHDALCDKALVAAHTAYENKDYQHAADLLKVAAKEADLSDASIHKHHVLREQVMVALAQKDPAAAEKFARQLVEFEKAQEHVGNSTAWQLQWADDMTRAEMLLGDALHAENKKKEALEVYKAAVVHANQSVAPVAVSVTASERYVQTLKELGLRKGTLITDPAAAAEAAEDYNDARAQMYAYRSHKQWAKVIEMADHVAASAVECKLTNGGVSAKAWAAVSEYLLGDKPKTHEYAEQSIKLANEHPDDAIAKQSSAGAWFLLAITDDNSEQAKKDMFTAYTVSLNESESTRQTLLKNLDQPRWNLVYDWFNELRMAALHRQTSQLRNACWEAWVTENLTHNRLEKGIAWFDKLFARGELDQQDLADCYQSILCHPKSLAHIDTRGWARKIVQIRERLRKQNPHDQINLSLLADAYERTAQNEKAQKLRSSLHPAGSLNNSKDNIKTETGDDKTPR